MNIKKIFTFGFGPIIAGILGLITLPILTWYFDQDDIGRYTLLQIFVSLNLMIFSLSLHQAYVREYYEVDNKKQLLQVSILPAILFFFIVIFALSLVKSIFPKYSISLILFNIDNFLIDLLIILTVFFNIFINIFNHVIRMQEKGLVYSLMQITPKLVFIIGVALLIWLGLNKNFFFLNFIFFISVFISFLVILILTRDDWKSLCKTELDMRLMKKTLFFSFPLIFGGIAYWGIFTLDRIFLKVYSGLGQVAIYSVASTLASSITLISGVFTTIWHPMVYRWVKEGVNKTQIQEAVDTVTLIVFFLWSVIGLLTWVISYFLPESYHEVEYLLVACASGPLLYLLSEVTVIGIGLSRKSQYSLYASFISFIFCIFLNMILVPLYGAKGAAITTNLTFGLLLILRSEFSNKLYDRFLSRKKIYILMLFYTMHTSYYTLFQPSVIFSLFIWFFLMGIVFFIYRKKLHKIVYFIKSK